MRKSLLPIVLLIALAPGAYAEEGTILEVTADTITIQQGGVKTLTFTVSNELLVNTFTHDSGLLDGPPAKFPQARKGDKVEITSRVVDGKAICVAIVLRRPSAVGVVTEVGANTITLRSDEGVTTTYKVQQELVEGHSKYNQPLIRSPLYPAKFSEVTPGCRIEVTIHKVHGEPTIMEVEVKKEKEKSP